MSKYTIRFRELVNYEIEIETDDLNEVAERARAIYEEGDFHPISDFEDVAEREVLEVVDALGNMVELPDLD